MFHSTVTGILTVLSTEATLNNGLQHDDRLPLCLAGLDSRQVSSFDRGPRPSFILIVPPSPLVISRS
jgi:hypothetical protein